MVEQVRNLDSRADQNGLARLGARDIYCLGKLR
jgi:hypothetical protein